MAAGRDGEEGVPPTEPSTAILHAAELDEREGLSGGLETDARGHRRLRLPERRIDRRSLRDAARICAVAAIGFAVKGLPELGL